MSVLSKAVSLHVTAGGCRSGDVTLVVDECQLVASYSTNRGVLLLCEHFMANKTRVRVIITH